MKIKLRHALTIGLAAALLTAGCGKPPALMMQQLAPDAPAGEGQPPAPVGTQPTPLLDRPPFGLYAIYPNRDTLVALSTAPLSPDGRYRATITAQGLWIARVDGAWLWEVPLPDVAVPKPVTPTQPAMSQPVLPTQPGTAKPPAGQTVSPATASKATKYLGPLDWTSQATLLLRDDAGTWVEINPEASKVTKLPAALQGKEWITYSPDRKQVMYYAQGTKGPQLWIAKADGTEPKFQGDNVTGTWGADGKVIITKTQPASPGAASQTSNVNTPPQPGQSRE